MAFLSRLRNPPLQARADLVSLEETYRRTDPSVMGHNFSEYTQSGLKASSVVFACILVRMQLVAQGRFYWRDFYTGERRTHNAGLEILRDPWPNGTIGDLLAAMELDASLAGNAYIHRATTPDGFKLQRLRPDWVHRVVHPNGSGVVGYMYSPGGIPNADSRLIDVADMAHYMPIPDPLTPWLGMSWLTPVARDVDNLVDMGKYQSAFINNAATPNLLIKVAGRLTEDQKTDLRNMMDRRHVGANNAYKTLYLEGGADATVLGKDMRQMEWTMNRAATENQVASASGVPAILANLKEGMMAATYSNAAQARRVFAMGTGSFLLQKSADALATILPGRKRPSDELTFDRRWISWFNEDALEAAQITQAKASTMETLIRTGYEEDQVAAAVEAQDLSGLTHSGLKSVQLQPPGTEEPETEPETEPESVPA